MILLLQEDTPFPSVTQALSHPNGLLAAGGDLSPARLLDAYRHGIFPWFGEGDPILWWSPDPRMVLIPQAFKLSHSLRKTLRRGAYQLRTDTAFEQVMRACAAPRDGQDGTWIQEQMVQAYCELHRLGHAHSVETWMEDQLVGGLYGIAIGKMFYGESMFSRRSDASKIALAHLCAQLQRWDFGMIDCQMNTPHLASLGAREIPRNEFLSRLQELINCVPITDFRFDTDLFA
ncbi:MAG: leucyl/phenylalanyl-tRNA--protein transferase [Gammaproteobacteria bacterium]|nr:leucyl/phenylalanyl-tRNA--protein transferase [Gammaproteobacteria bacterium]MBU1623441.1 leucyl/phenylalanyl-tRNA--protein transferase [Gammaproteobacteria bacterium]MBU1982280.1 leucyl/phenylalanyl-tRNA--protein transferase [Gammaproteobacteria bacterium]